MFNLIRMDVHRLFHSVSTWVIMGLVIAIAMFSVIMTNIDIQLMKENPQSVATEEGEERTVGIYISSDSAWAMGKIEAGSVVSAELRSGLLVICCIIFTAIFTNAEQKNGFIKNIAGLFPKRGELVLSKVAAIAIQVFLMLLGFTLMILATGFLLWKSSFYMGSIVSLLKFLGVQYLLHLGYSMLILFLCILTKSTAFSMTVGILLCSGLQLPLYSLLNKAVYEIQPGWDFDINRFVLDGNIARIGVDAVSGAMLRGFLVGLAFTVAATIGSMLLVKNRDVQ